MSNGGRIHNASLQVTAGRLVEQAHDEADAEHERQDAKHDTDIVGESACYASDEVSNSSSRENTCLLIHPSSLNDRVGEGD